MNEVQAIVKFNDDIAFALANPVKFTYYREGNLIIGLDDTCTFVHCYYYQHPSYGFKAFGGREFDIHLENGEVVHCNGQWWDGGYLKAAELLGEELIDVTYNDVETLKNCYVYYGATGIKSRVEELRRSYTGEVQGYWDYEAKLKGRDNALFGRI